MTKKSAMENRSCHTRVVIVELHLSSIFPKSLWEDAGGFYSKWCVIHAKISSQCKAALYDMMLSTCLTTFRWGSRADRLAAVNRRPGGRGQAGPDGQSQDVAAQISLQDEGLKSDLFLLQKYWMWRNRNTEVFEIVSVSRKQVQQVEGDLTAKRHVAFANDLA